MKLNSYSKKWLIAVNSTLSLFLFALPSYGQLTLNQPNTSGTFTAPQSITLLPGFSTSGNFEAKIQSAPKPAIIQNPSQNQNYVIQNKIRVSGITTPSQIAGLSADGLQQTITYYDGLGRPMQNVQTQASPDLQDIVTPIIYDSFGRIEKNYLSYASTGTGDGSYKANALTDINNFYNPVGGTDIQLPGGIPRIPTPFAKTVFEPSPLNRILEQGFPGNTWQPASSRTSGSNPTGRTVVTEFSSNTDQNGIRKVKMYSADVTTENNHMRSLSDRGWYEANQLYVSIIKDENWILTDDRNGTMEEYTDKEGKLILKRVIKDSEILSTYYVYDDLGNLNFVIPAVAEPDGGNIDQTKLNNYCYQYYYDGRRRLIEKKLPGKEWEYLVYNKLDQVVMTQDGNQRSKSPQEWTISKYDALGRLLISGLYNHTGSTSGANIRQNLQMNVDAQSIIWESRISTGNGYTNDTWPITWHTTLTINYYDDYNIPGLPTNYLYPPGSKMTKSLLTATLTKILDGTTGNTNMLWNINHYDDKGRVVKIFKQHFKDGLLAANNYDEINNAYDFTDLVQNTTRKHIVNGSQVVFVLEEYIYDHTGRKKEIWQTINDANRTLLVKNNYNAVGQLIEKKLHSTDGTNFAQTVTQTYNERGWLVSTESPLFAMELQYTNGANPQYNGNISGQLWGLPATKDKNYVYSYDRLNRLNSGINNENYDELLSYDKAGNILSLQRKKNGNELVDQLTYGYNNSNRLNTVFDAVSNNSLSPYQFPGTTSYGYDNNGNMITRTNENNATRNISLNYNLLNLPYQISGSHMATYIYDASGRKLRMVSGSNTFDYIDGIQYTGSTLKLIQNEVGKAVRNGTSYSYEYTINDHLGNVRVSFDVFGGNARKIQQDDYYPFGLPINRYASGDRNNYLFNGKELQEAITLYDYGSRFYDPVIARFGTIDKFAEKYYNLSSYQYAALNPISNIDINGDSIYIANGKEKILYHEGKLYWANQGNKAYDGKALNKKGELTGFVSKVKSALDKIDSKSSGSELVDAFQNSKFDNIQIQKGSENNERSGLISWNPSNRNSNIPNEDGSKGRDPFIALAHEMGHSWDRSTRSDAEVNAPWYTTSDGKTIPQSEKVSTWWENRVRSEHGAGLRGYYSFTDVAGTLQGDKSGSLLIPGTNKSLYINVLGGQRIPYVPFVGAFGTVLNSPYQYK